MALLLSQRVVKKAGEFMLLFHRRSQPLKEFVLWLAMHDPIRSRDEQLGGCRDSRGVGDDAIGGGIDGQQDLHGDGPPDQRIGCVGSAPLWIVRQRAALHIRLHVEVSEQPLQQRQTRAGERHIELDLERWSGQHHAANPGRVVVNPARHQNAPEALRQDCDILHRDSVGAGDVAHEGVDVLNQRSEIRIDPLLIGRAAVPAGVPRKHRQTGQVQLVDDVLHASGVLVPTMKENQSLAGGTVGGPIPIEQTCSVASLAIALFGYAHFEPASSSPPRTRFKTVTANSRATILGRAYEAQDGSPNPSPSHSATAPNTRARSLLPMGPS